MTEPAIRVDGLTRDFGQMRAVNHVSLEVPMGSIFGFLGPNGAGKTTTINLLLGLLAPTSGRAAVLGFDTSEHPDEVRAHTGALLEDDGIYEQLTVEENLEFCGRVWRLSPRELRTRMEELLTHLGLWDRRTDRAGTWSRGMKRRLALVLPPPEISPLSWTELAHSSNAAGPANAHQSPPAQNGLGLWRPGGLLPYVCSNRDWRLNDAPC